MEEEIRHTNRCRDMLQYYDTVHCLQKTTVKGPSIRAVTAQSFPA